MPSVTNTRVIFNEHPTGSVILNTPAILVLLLTVTYHSLYHSTRLSPDKTVVVDKSATIDFDNELLNGGVLVKVLLLSVDPYLRKCMDKRGSYFKSFTIGEPIFAHGISRVIRSENAQFSVGDYLYGFHSFAEYAVLKDLESYQKLDNSEGLPWSTFLGVCGMPGRTAHHGYKEFMEPYVRKGDTIFITAGAGSVGSLVIQLAKLDGMKVIASAGSDEKVKFMEACGADIAFNYKKTDTKQVLEEHGPINFYWDHVGDYSLDCALDTAAEFGHFLICGLISTYNGQLQQIKNFGNILWKSLTVNGFVVYHLEEKHNTEFLCSIPPKVAKGGIKYAEDIRHGLESVGQALLDVQTGKNTGKTIIEVAED